jgi:hypothetical protein
VHVANSGRSQLCRQNLPVKLGGVSRSRDAADVYHALNSIRSQKFKEVFPCSCRMPDRQYHELFDSSFSQERTPFSPTHQEVLPDTQNIPASAKKGRSLILPHCDRLVCAIFTAFSCGNYRERVRIAMYIVMRYSLKEPGMPRKSRMARCGYRRILAPSGARFCSHPLVEVNRYCGNFRWSHQTELRNVGPNLIAIYLMRCSE